MIDPTDADLVGYRLLVFAESLCGVPGAEALARRMDLQGRWWRNAALVADGGEGTLVPAGAVSEGTVVLDEHGEVSEVVRVLHQGPRMSLHLRERDTGIERYINPPAPDAPVATVAPSLRPPDPPSDSLEDEPGACPQDPDGQHFVGCGCEDSDVDLEPDVTEIEAPAPSISSRSLTAHRSALRLRPLRADREVPSR